MAPAWLDQKLLARIAERQKRPVKSIRERVSRLASKLGIPSQAALLVLAWRHGIGIARPLKRLSPEVQQQVHAALVAGSFGGRRSTTVRRTGEEEHQLDPAALVIDNVLTDDEIRSRCRDLLRRKRHLDRAVREAMTVLEDRLRARTGLTRRQERSRVGLVAKALHPESGVLDLGVDQEEQQGVFDFCKGLMEMFGNPMHHSLRDDVTQQEAISVCAAANLMLVLVDRANVRRAQSVPST